MNEEIRMSVSSLIRKDRDKSVYVLFSDGAKSAEFVVPTGKLLRNDGFTQEDIRKLQEYLANEETVIYDMAKDINPIKGFMKGKT